MEHYKKRLIFAFYVYPSWKDDITNKMHLLLLEKYLPIFDEITICLTIDKEATENDILMVEKAFVNIAHSRRIIFKRYENTNFRESKIFFDEIATRLNSLDGLTFFAHNKGVTEQTRPDILEWICGLYYFSLEHIDDVEYAFNNRKICYGSFPQLSPFEECEWFYAGTFFWINCPALSEKMQKDKISNPLLNDRWYDEFYLGKIVDIQGNRWGDSGWFMPYMDMNDTLYIQTSERTHRTYETEYNDFYKFYQNLIWKE